MIRSERGFTLIEIAVGVAVFLVFTIGVFSALSMVFKMVYQSRLHVLETAVATEQIEIIRNIPFSSVGVAGGVPNGVLSTKKTLVRAGVTFNVTTTVHNVDDPFDGTATTTPTDADPADFKLVQVSVQCVNCDQFKPVIMTTQISPKGLETASTNGSLFIQVVNANGQPISGATVQIVNASTSPAINTIDLTGSDGWLRLLDMPTSTLKYNLTVTKGGYSSDYTINASASNPSPTKLPASVASETVTTVNFSIDQVGTMAFHTMNTLCAAIGSAPFVLRGQKQIGSLPVVYKYNQTLTTNGSGDYSLSNVEWDTYTVSSTGVTYDLAGTIPMSPFALLPGASQDVSVILKAHTTRTLLVKVKDAGTGLPLSGATVRLTSAGGYDTTLMTGLGYVQQTDWSGGSGQAMFDNSMWYASDDARIDATSLPGDVTLRRLGGVYFPDGYLESSTFDLGTAVNFSNVIINPSSQATTTGSNPVLLQLASSNSSTPATWDFLGPDGTAATYYTVTNTIVSADHAGKQYVRYKLYLQTGNTSVSPAVSDIFITYTTSCVAPGQSFFSNLAADTYTLEVSRDGYATNSGQLIISGNLQTQVNLSPL